MMQHSASLAAEKITFSDTVTGIVNGRILALTLDNPPVNAISASIREGLMQALDLAECNTDIDAIIVHGAGKFFAAGADIKEFDAPLTEPNLPQVTNRIEGFAKPVIATINGPALGGGCEIILACHYRIALQQAQFGLPEVKLGIIPGAGGTQRLPRLTNLATAIEMIGTGKTISADEALTLGLIDQISTSDAFLTDAHAAAVRLTAMPLRRASELDAPTDEAASQIEEILRKARGKTAPKEAVRVISLTKSMPFAQALAEERQTFLKLRESNEAKALRHVFFAERDAGKDHRLSGISPREIKTIGIAGTGLMGSGIAVAALAGGYEVIGYEQTAEAAAQGYERIAALLNKQHQSGRLSDEALHSQLSNLAVSNDMNTLSDVDLIFEAVFDDLKVKSDLVQRLDSTLRPDAIIATNTSYLNPDELALLVSHPERVIGMHFFSPAHIMRLLEVVDCAQTAPQVLVTTLAVAKRLNKLAIISGVCQGFIGNRVFSAYRREAEFIVEQGALPHEIDAALEAYGFPMGLFAVCDMAGLEIAWAKRKRAAALKTPDEAYCAIPDLLCEAGRFGQKSGKGWYQYHNGKRAIDAEVTVLIEAERLRKKISPRQFTEDEIIHRLLNAMYREGKALLDEGIAARASDIDLVMINGYGFPAHNGGPMFAAEN
jgi:3-hydroxyacyl-CoA dehydrogenase